MTTTSAPIPIRGPLLSGGNKILVLSDIHIGDNSKTVWYQQSVHEKFLLAILNWASREPLISEVVLLGDIIDFWTYPFSITPPSFATITAANPNVFGLNGGLAALLDAKDGAVTYVEGNHDFGVTAADVATIKSPKGHAVRFAGSEYRVAGHGNQGIVFTHGHLYTLFNAPDPTTPWQINPQPGTPRGLPVGHFVTRMVATKWQRDLRPGQTVADLPGQGAPNGLDLAGIIDGIIARGGEISIARALLDSVASQTGCGQTDSILLPFGLPKTTLAEVGKIYDNLWEEWVNAAPSAEIGLLIALKAAFADARGNYLGWFAQKRAFQAVADAIVMGHTHLPINGLRESLTTYANSGFESPSLPDMDQQFMSFALIDSANLKTEILRITSPSDQGFVIDTCPADSTGIIETGSQDFSSYVIIDNTLNTPLTLGKVTLDQGYFVVPPPSTIPPGARAMLWIQDYPITYIQHGQGTGALFTYTAGSTSYRFSFRCPLYGDNDAWVKKPSNFRTKSGSQVEWWPAGHVEKAGHPFFVWFSVGA
jgi:predicted phosphodiesterase